MLSGFITIATLAAMAFTALDFELLQRILQHQGDPLVWTLFVLAILPLTLACWAVPLAVAYRLIYDRRLPAGLPSWQHHGRSYLMAHYTAPFWTAYSACFSLSLLFLPCYLISRTWPMVYLETIGLLLTTSTAFIWQQRRNQTQMVVIDQTGLFIPTYALIAHEQLSIEMEEELLITPRQDHRSWWVKIQGRRWKRCQLPEQAEAIMRWLQEQSGTRRA